MNERIRELAEQAIIVVDNHTLIEEEELKKMYIPDCFSEKFAQLIVRECCDFFVELRTRPADLAVKDVKKHFGVEL